MAAVEGLLPARPVGAEAKDQLLTQAFGLDDVVDHVADPGRQHPAGSALCLGVTLAGLVGLAVTISWLFTLIRF